MDVSSPESQPRPWSSAWSSTPAAARWRAAQPWPPANYVGLLIQPLNYPAFLTALRPPPSDVAPEIDAEAAYSSARAHAPCPKGSGGPAISLAIADSPDCVNTLVYVLRWENVPWSPSGPPQPVGSPPSPRAVGPCLVLIDATTGGSLGAMYMTAHRASTAGRGLRDASSLEETGDDSASYWESRPHMDARFVVKAAALTRWSHREAIEACRTLAADTLPTRLTDIGAAHARRLHALDQALGPFIGADERATVAANLESMIGIAEKLIGQFLPYAEGQLARAATAVFDTSKP